MNNPRIFPLAILTLFPLSAANAEQRPMSIDDGLRMVQLEDVTMSPDGSLALYGTRSLDWSDNDYVTRHYLFRASDGSTVRYIGEAGGESFAFSPDGGKIAFLRAYEAGEDEEEESQIFVMSVGGGEALKLTSHRGGVSRFQWLPDSDGFIFVASEQLSEEDEAERKKGDDAFFVDEAPNGKHAARYTNFWRANLDDGEAHRLSNWELVIGEFDVSPDGGRIVFTARPDLRTNYPGQAELYLFAIGDEEADQITDNEAPESSAMWSPDSKLIAYRAPNDRTHELRAGYFWILDPASREMRRLDGQNTGEMSTQPVWSSDSRSYCTARFTVPTPTCIASTLGPARQKR